MLDSLRSVNHYLINGIKELINEGIEFSFNKDIVCSKNNLLFKKNQTLDIKNIDTLKYRKLFRPLESSLNIINENELKERIQNIINITYAELIKKNENCPVLKNYKINAGHFTVLPNINIFIYLLMKKNPERILYTAIVNDYFYRNILNRNDFNGLLSGLLNDLGTLYISNDFIDLSFSKWKEYTIHPIISKIILESIAPGNTMLGMIIMDHHERSDGLGYPRRLKQHQISIESLILSLSDTYVALTKKALCPINHLKTIVKIIPNEWDQKIVSFVTSLKPGCSINNINIDHDQYMERMHALFMRIALVINEIQLLEKDLLLQKDPRAISLIRESSQRINLIQKSYSSSGITEIINSKSGGSPDLDKEIILECSSILNEIEWRFTQLSRYLLLAIDNVSLDAKISFEKIIELLGTS